LETGWQDEYARAITEPTELLAVLELPRSLLPDALAAGQTFALRVPRGYVARMRKGNPEDPLLRQVLPIGAELKETPGFYCDPVGDTAAMAVPGLLHKYEGRVLLLTTGACAVHCRYCFRRHFAYDSASLSIGREAAALAYITADESVTEVILSGGDPLSLHDQRLGELIQRLGNIPHLRRLRIHTRLPIVIPARVTDALLDALTATRLLPVLVVHANHAQEIDSSVHRAMQGLKERGVTVLNQSVLLRGVNDSCEALVQLSERLFEAGIMPYYLHLLDRAQGTAHFEAPETVARLLETQLRRRLPGYLVPQLVREQRGAPSKLALRELVQSDCCQPQSDNNIL